MKKVLLLLMVLVAGFALVACGPSSYEIAMITDTGDIDDGSFNQGTWEGIVEYSEEFKKSHKYYKPAGEATTDYMAAIDLAVAGGAKIVITPGFYFETPIFQAQTKYPDVKFVLIDGSPHSGDFNPVVGDNTLSIFFKEEQAGFLAAYASYKEGLTNLGFMGGIAVPAVQRFGIGWVAGAYQAAKDAANTTYAYNPTHYTYLGTFGPSDSYKTEAATWYSAGVQVIHAAAGGAGLSVMAAAQDATNKWVVGVDSDQADDSTRVLTSAMKGVGTAAYDALEAFYADEFPGGETWNLDVSDDAVGLPMTTSRFTTFTEANYNTILNTVKAGTISVPATAAQLETFITGLGYTVPAGLIAAIND
ncbi:BMP family lipoprotein [Acholeplasma granularum]|uniref:BMP family lipoprotein n=1 Tax=Acholeplasma granularum TaxID=264635 RepID=UPI00046F9404|nr:BMP family ABC transporter substrate-binding protein [Acholeplasma granularum]